MKQKTLISIILFISICLIFTISFAAEAMNTMKDSMETMGNTAGNVIDTATGSVSNGIRGIATGTRNMIENMTDDNSDMIGMQESNYNTTRTSTSNNNLLGLSTNAWLWIIMGTVGAIIIALVWYYGSQYEDQGYNHNR